MTSCKFPPCTIVALYSNKIHVTQSNYFTLSSLIYYFANISVATFLLANQHYSLSRGWQQFTNRRAELMWTEIGFDHLLLCLFIWLTSACALGQQRLWDAQPHSPNWNHRARFSLSVSVCAHISDACGKTPARQIHLALISNSDIIWASALVSLLGAFALKQPQHPHYIWKYSLHTVEQNIYCNILSLKYIKALKMDQCKIEN